MSDILDIDIKILNSVKNKIQVSLGEKGRALLDIPVDSGWWEMHEEIKKVLSLNLRYENPIELIHKEEMYPIKPYLNKEYSSFSISPDLPEGLYFDQATGTLSGTPTESITAKEFIIKADSDSFSFLLTIIEPAPTDLFYDVPDIESETEIYLKPSYKGEVDFFMVDKDLPLGLVFNEATGEITGSTLELVDSKSFTIISQNKFGGTSFKLVLKIVNNKPKFSYGTPFFTAQRDRLFDVYPHILGPIEGFNIHPELPEGLIFSEETGRIKGMPKEVSKVKYKSEEFIVTAHNGDQSYSDKISILRVIPSPKNLKYAPVINLTIGTQIDPIAPSNIDGDAHTLRYCAWLPEGLSIDVLTGIITGTPVELGSEEIKVVVSNSSGTAQYIFILNID